MIEVIHEHSVEMDLLPKRAFIADLGCRGFGFTNHFRELGHAVWAVDIDNLGGEGYDQCAITDHTGECGIWRNNDPQATKIDPLNINIESVRCYTLDDYMKLKGVEFFDLIKSDIEGAEYEMIMNLTKPPSRQISIEFHMHCYQTAEQVNEIVLKLNSLGYSMEQHIYETRHGAGFNYWDSLFLLK